MSWAVAFSIPAVSYRVFARKYRPQTFAEVVGQDHITRTLQNAVNANRLAQAYLFVGPRGIGKTSTARILAKALNCVNGPTSQPCGECDVCKEIAEGRNLDVIEIDGASNNGVENIRDLRDNAAYAPTRGPFKIYLIDEVHMLSTGAFNALLKTLEEPPAHVKFIFATTEAQKVPATITSRCQRFDLRRIPSDLIQKHLLYIAENEKITLDADAAASLSRDGLLDFLIGVALGPTLGQDRWVALTHYPASQAALAELDPQDPRVALRFEFYGNGIELANGFQELGHAGQQRERFIADNAARLERGLPTRALDEYLLTALEHGLPPCSGVAVGFDRLLMVASDAQHIRDVMTFTTEHA